jgi:ABC-type antimicrobial peptide transport system permease subunit
MGRHLVGAVQSIEAQSDIFFMRERVLGGIGLAFAILSTLIGALGLYALMAFTATKRIREAGIRMALGASKGSVIRLLAFDVGRLVLVGIGAGIPLGLMAGRAAGSLLAGIPPSDTSSMVAAVVTLAVTGGLACALPTLGVVKAGLTNALRAE